MSVFDCFLLLDYILINILVLFLYTHIWHYQNKAYF